MVAHIGLIIEGQGEIAYFQKILGKLYSQYNFAKAPLRADLQPKAATANAIARQAEARVKMWLSRGVRKIVVLIDREDHPCAITFAQDLTRAFYNLYKGIDFAVIVKDHTIENWLIADMGALKQLSSRFRTDPAINKRIINAGADSFNNAAAVLDNLVQKGNYAKGSDPERIGDKQSIFVVAEYSRSFRKFLREMGCPVYSKQSKSPQKATQALKVAAAAHKAQIAPLGGKR